MRSMGALAFPGFELLDLFGPLEMFGILEGDFTIEIVGVQSGTVASRQGPAVHASTSVGAQPTYDLILIPGGLGTRALVNDPDTIQWIKHASEHAEVVMSVCTGAALLARAGFLDGKRATTNKLAFEWVVEQAGKVQWIKKARWVEDGNTFTSAGVSAGIDMSLAVVARLLGQDTAEKTADWAEYSWNHDPDWDPFAEKAGLLP